MRCWSCRFESGAARCPRCHQPLTPSQDEARELSGHIRYLLGEIPRWSAPPNFRTELESRYRGCLARLSALEEAPPLAAETPVAEPELARVEAAQPEPARVEAPPGLLVELDDSPIETVAPPESPPERADLRDFLAESNIRWFHTLGAVLLLSAGVGYLRAEWGGLGRQLAALLLTFLPVLFFAGAQALRARLPLSSRLLAMIGGVMLPTGLLSLNHFHVAGLTVDPHLWSPFAFGLSTLVLGVLSVTLQEAACVFLAAITWTLAAATTGSGLLLGLASFGAAGLALHVSWRKQGAWISPVLLQLSHILGAVGLLAGMLRAPASHDAAATALLLGAVYFASFAYLHGNPRLLWLSSLSGLGGAWACVNFLDLPPTFLALATLVQGTFYLARAGRNQAVDGTAFRLATVATGAVLALVLGAVPANGSAALTGLLGCLFYAVTAVLYGRPAWMYAAAACLTYGATVLLHLAGLPPAFWLLFLALAWQAACYALPQRQLTGPWMYSALGLATLLVPCNAALHDGWAQLAIAHALSALAWSLGAHWTRESRLLYPALAAGLLSYACLPLGIDNPGLFFLPLAAAYALAGRWLRPAAHAALLVAVPCMLAQLVYLSAVCLFLGCAGFALASRRTWPLALWSLLGGILCQGHLSLESQALALGLAALVALAGAPFHLAEAALAWCLVVSVGPNPTLAAFPPLIWAACHFRQRHRHLDLGATALGWAALLLHESLIEAAWLPVLLAGALVGAGRPVCAWTFMVLLPLRFGPHHFSTWWALQLVLAVYLGWSRDRLVRQLNVLTAVLALVASLSQDQVTALQHAGLNTLVGLAAALALRDRATFRGACGLLVVTVVEACHWAHQPMAPAFALLALALIGAAELLPWVREDCRVLAAAATVPALFSEQFGVVLLGVPVWMLRARRGARANHWGAFAFAYVAWTRVLHDWGWQDLEGYTFPLALWLLVWAERLSPNPRPWRRAGLAALLLPTLGLSLTVGGWHSLAGGGLGLALFCLPIPAYRMAGCLALLIEIAIQAVAVAVYLPWQLLAAAGGILLVAFGISFERQRLAWLAAAQRLQHSFQEL